MALTAIVALAITAIVIFARPESRGDAESARSAPNSDSGVASANDTGPANIITADPTCEAWSRLARDAAATAEAVKWNDRNADIPADRWTPEQRRMYETVGDSVAEAANLTKNIAKQSPYRVMRELYKQFIAYADAFNAAIDTYTPQSRVADVVSSLMSGLASMCSAIDYDAVQSLAPLVAQPEQPTEVSEIDDERDMSLGKANPVCDEIVAASDKYTDDTRAWLAIDPKIPATKWTPEQQAVNNAVAPVMSAYADQIEQLGRRSGKPVFEDITVLTAQYTRAYVVALPSYTAADNFLTDVTRYLGAATFWACKTAA